MNPKYVEAFKEIQHLVTNAILRGDEDIAVETLRMIAELSNAAIDGAAGVRALPGCPSLMPAKVIPHDEPAAEVPRTEVPRRAAKDAAIRGEVRAAKTPMTVVFQSKIDDNRELSAEINSETADHRTAAYLFDGPHVVCKIEFFDQYQGRNWAYPIVRRALNGLMSKAGKGARHRKLAAKRLMEQRGKDSAAPVEEESVNG